MILRVAGTAAMTALLVLTGTSAPVRAEDARGREVFEARCASCHAVEPGQAGLPGPNLAGVAGRRVAGDPAFDYSPVLRGAASDPAWDAARLDRFLEDPEEMYPGLWMGGNGIGAAADRAAVVRYLTGG